MEIILCNLLQRFPYYFFSTTTFATNVSNDFKGSINITTVCPSETTEINLNFNSIEDFLEFDVNQLVTDELTCTFSISVSVNEGYDSSSASVTLNAEDLSGDEVRETILKLRKSATVSIKR